MVDLSVEGDYTNVILNVWNAKEYFDTENINSSIHASLYNNFNNILVLSQPKN
jgi:hypothetical protein